MFWKYNITTASHIETILDNDNVVLKELMDEDDILQECKAQTPKLINFLVRPDVMTEMVTLVTQEPDDLVEERNRYKYSNIACELLTFDVPAINDALVIDNGFLDKLYGFINTEKQLNPLLASFFSKTMSKLLLRKTDVVFPYISSKPNFLSLLLNHIETSAIMDLLVKLLTYIENIETRLEIQNWLKDQDIVNRLVALIDPSFSEDCNCNAAQVLVDMIKSSRDQMSALQEKAEADPLLEAMESTEVVANLLNHMFNGEKRESVIVNGVAVLLALLEFKKHGPASTNQMLPTQGQPCFQGENAPQTFASIFFRNDGPEQMTSLDGERLAKGVSNVLAAITPRLVDLHQLLLVPPVKPAITLTIGCLDPPLGSSRLEVARLLMALLATNTHDVNVQLSSLGTFVVLMDLFFNYTWNNFLHTQVEHAINRIICNAPTVNEEGNKVHPLLNQFLTSYKITQRIMECFEEPHQDGDSSAVIPHRKGYMGHLTQIANHISQNSENGVNSALIQEKLKELPEEQQERWEKFRTVTLAEINLKNTAPLVGEFAMPSGSDGSVKGIPFTHESALQQAFSNYQVQQISSNFVDQFCFNEDFAEADDNLTGQLNRLAHVHFHLSDDNLLQGNVELFEQVCRDRAHGSDDADSDEDVWDDKDKSYCFRQRKQSEDNSSDSDDDANVPSTSDTPAIVNNDEMKMEIDNQDGWAANFDAVPMEVVAPVSVQNPWDASEQPSSTSGEQENWADFSSFTGFGSSSVDCSDEISSTTAVAMETSETIPPVKFVSSSEVSSTSDTTPTLVPSIPAQRPGIEQVALDDNASCEISPPSFSDSTSSKESEIKSLVVNDSDHPNTSASQEKDTCTSSSTVQNGPL